MKRTATSENALSNQFTVAAGHLVIPYGDHPHKAGVQRFTRAAAEKLAAGFHGLAQRLGRLFGGNPIFVGHPDDPAFANEHTDRKAYGWVGDVQALDDGLHLIPKWSPSGEELVANAHYKWFSPRWAAVEIGREAGRVILEPVRLVSVGLTNQPNIQGMAPLANEEDEPDAEAPQEEAEMRERLLKLLNLKADCTDEELQAAYDAHLAAQAQAADAANALTTANAQLTTDLAAAQGQVQILTANVAAERGGRIVLLLNEAEREGRITPAQRGQWAQDLAADFAAKAVELANAKPALHVASVTADLGARKTDSTAMGRQQKILTLVNQRMETNHEPY